MNKKYSSERLKRDLIYIEGRLAEIPKEINELKKERETLADVEQLDQMQKRRRIYLTERLALLEKEHSILVDRRRVIVAS